MTLVAPPYPGERNFIRVFLALRPMLKTRRGRNKTLDDLIKTSSSYFQFP